MTKSFKKISLAILTVLLIMSAGLFGVFMPKIQAATAAGGPLYIITESGVDSTSAPQSVSYEYNSAEAVKNALSGGAKGKYSEYYGITLTLNADIELPEVDYSGTQVKLEINLNGHTLKLTGDRNYTYQSVKINGDGGVIDFSGDTVTHSGNVFLINAVNDTYSEKGLEIENVTLQNIKAGRLFSIDYLGDNLNSVNLNNTVIKNGTFTENGGALYLHSIKHSEDESAEVSIIDSSFINCKTTGKGGAIYFNTVGVHNDDKIMSFVLTGSSFINCSAKDGGAIFLAGSCRNVHLGNSLSDSANKNLFYGCTASRYGGAVYLEGFDTFALISVVNDYALENMVFVNNEAKDDEWGGGAVHVYAQDVAIKNCEFYFNKGAGYGGAVSVDENEVEFDSCVFACNKSEHGNDIYVGSNKDGKSIKNCVFYGNGTNSIGGGSFNEKTNNDYSASAIKFSNSANYDNGNLIKGDSHDNPILIDNAYDMLAFAVNVQIAPDIYANGYYKLTGDVENVFVTVRGFYGEFDFDGHVVSTMYYDRLFLRGECQLISPLVKNIDNIEESNDKICNIATIYDSGTTARDYYLVDEAKNALLVGPLSDVRGVVITLYSDIALPEISYRGTYRDLYINLNGHKLTVTGSRSYIAQCIHITDGTIDFGNVEHDGAIFTNKAVSGGSDFKGGLYLESVTFQNIKAGNLFILENTNSSEFEFEIKNVTVKDGTVDENGGVFYINKTVKTVDMNFENCTFKDISSTEKGSVLFVNSAHDELKMTDCDFINCSSEKNGGAIYVNTITNSDVDMTNCNFINCSSDEDGGAIYVYQLTTNFYLEGCNFLGCTSGDDGGAIFIGENCDGAFFGWKDSAYYHKPLFYNCSAKGYGGAIYIDKADDCTLENMIFVNNEAKNSEWGGGAIHVFGKDATIAYCEFYLNKGAGYGGAVSVDEDGVYFLSCVFAGNASNKGKDIYVGSNMDAKELTYCILYGYDSAKSIQGDDFAVVNENSFIAGPMVFSDSSNYNVGELVKGDSCDNPILIKDQRDFIALAVNSNLYHDTYANLYYRLTKDVSGIDAPVRSFTGNFDFNGYTVKTRINDALFNSTECCLVSPNVENIFNEQEDISKTKVNYSDFASGTEEIKYADAEIINQYNEDEIESLTSGIYVIQGTVNVSKRIIIDGDVSFIFTKDAVLNANNGIELHEGNTLSVYSQFTDYPGTVNAICQDKVGAGIGGGYAAVYQFLVARTSTGTSNNNKCFNGYAMGTFNVHAVNVNAEGNGGAGIGGGKGGAPEFFYLGAQYICSSQIYFSACTVPGLGGNGGTLNVYVGKINAVGNGGRDIGGGDGGDGGAYGGSISQRVGGSGVRISGIGGGDGATVNVFGGTIIAMNNGIGGGNGGAKVSEAPITYYTGYGYASVNSIYIYNCAAFSQIIPSSYGVYYNANGGNGGAGGVLNASGARIFAKRISGGEGVVAQLGWQGGQKGTAPIIKLTDMLIYVTDQPNGDISEGDGTYSSDLNDLIQTKYVAIYNKTNGCSHIDENDDGICDTCEYVLYTPFNILTESNGSCMVRVGQNIYNIANKLYTVNNPGLFKLFYENGREVGQDDKIPLLSSGSLNVYAILKCTEPSGRRSYYYNCSNERYYWDENCSREITDFNEWYMNGYTEVDYVRGSRTISLPINSYSNTRVEMEAAFFAYTGGKTVGNLGTYDFRFLNFESACIFEVFDSWFHESRMDAPKLNLGEKYNVSFGYSNGGFPSFTVKRSDGTIHFNRTYSHNGYFGDEKGNLGLLMSDMAVHSFKVYAGNVLIYDLVPLLENESGEYVLYDKCSQMFYRGGLSKADVELIDLGEPYGKVYYSTTQQKYYKDIYGYASADILNITFAGDYVNPYFGYKSNFVLPVCEEAGLSFVFELNGKIWDGKTFGKDILTVNVIKIQKFDGIDATCTEDGQKTYYKYNEIYYSDKLCTQKIEDLEAWLSPDGEGFIDALGHDYTVTYTWNGDKCTAHYFCTHGCGTDEVSETVSATYVVDSPETCLGYGTGHYEDKVKFKNSLFSDQDVLIGNVVRNALGHVDTNHDGYCDRCHSEYNNFEIVPVRSNVPTVIDVKENKYLTVEMEFIPYAYTGEKTVAAKDAYLWRFFNYSGGCTLDVGDGGNYVRLGCVAGSILTLGEKYYVSFGYKNDDGTNKFFLLVKQNGKQKFYQEKVVNIDTVVVGASDIALYMSDMTLYSCNIYAEGALVRYLVPIVDDLGNYYLLDQLNQELYPIGNTSSALNITYTGDYEGSYTGIAQNLTLPICEDDDYRYKFYVDGMPWYGTTFISNNFTVTVEKIVNSTRTDKVYSTCTVAGSKEYYTYKGEYYSDELCTQKIEDLQAWLGEGGDGYFAPIGHDWEITYVWSNGDCIATATCKNDSNHKETETVECVYAKDTDATCTEREKGHYVATFTNSLFSEQITEENSAKIGNPLGHDYKITYTWNGTSCTATYACTHGCGIDTVTETVEAKYVKDSDASCGASEKGHYKATFTNGLFSEQVTATNSVENGDPLGHDYEITYGWNGSSCTATAICKRDNSHKVVETVTGEYVKDSDKTCENPEKGHYKATFSSDLFSEQETETGSVNNGDPLGHDFNNYVSDGNATCEHDGTKTSKCSRCEVTDTVTDEGTKLGHDYEITYAWNGNSCTATAVCKHDNSHTVTETVTGAYVKDSDATTESNEKGHYEATFDNPIFAKQTGETNSVEKPDTKLEKKGGCFGAISVSDISVIASVCLIAMGIMLVIRKKKNKNV